MLALIYDFDGVIADSEVLANLVLAEQVSGLGRPTSLDESLDRYAGKRWADVALAIERDLGSSLPDSFVDCLQSSTLAKFNADLLEVAGASGFVSRYHDLPHCIASSSSLQRLRICLAALGLAKAFEDRVFSSEMVERGSPFRTFSSSPPER